MITPCGCTQALEADPATTFNICDNAGAPAFTENGITAIPQGAEAQTILFAVNKASVDYVFVELAVENLVDSNTLIFTAEVISRQLGSFRVVYTGLADSTNYRLRWNLYVSTIS